LKFVEIMIFTSLIPSKGGQAREWWNEEAGAIYFYIPTAKLLTANNLTIQQ